MGCRWCGWERLQGHRSIRRVYGPDLDAESLRILGHSGFHAIFFSAGTTGVAEESVAKLQSRFPGINIVGTFTPPFRPLNEAELRRSAGSVRGATGFLLGRLEHAEAGAFHGAHLEVLPEAKVFIGVGAAFDLLTGRVRQAPRWMQRSGLEWFFRLTQEPGRLWKRYLR